jgi:Trypsin
MGRRLRVSVLILLVSLICVLAWAGSATAIQFGQPDGDNHPYVCLVVFYDQNDKPLWRTTGELISSTVVLTAGHGTFDTSGARVWFLKDIPPNPEGSKDKYPFGGPDSYHGTPYTNPQYRDVPLPGLPGFDYHDVGIVVLDTAVPASVANDYAELPTAGVVDTLSPKHPVDLVGYGVNYQEHGGGVLPYDTWQWLRQRQYAPAQVVQTKSRMASEFLKLTANPAQGKGGITFGDSGGPILDRDTDVVFALNAFVSNSNCSGVSYAQRIDIPDILAWINSFPRVAGSKLP